MAVSLLQLPVRSSPFTLLRDRELWIRGSCAVTSSLRILLQVLHQLKKCEMVSTTQEGVSSPDSVPGEGACSGKCAAVKDTDADAMSPSDGDNIEDVQSALEDARRRAMEDDPDFMRRGRAWEARTTRDAPRIQR